MTHEHPSGPTWYDILGVAPDATAEQVKAAWREATDKFEPGQGSGQFRLFNEAADVLLDPAKRAAYDAEIGTAEVEPTPEPAPVVPGAPEVPEAAPDAQEAAPDAPAKRRALSLTTVLAVCVPLLLVSLLVVVGSISGLKIGGLRIDSVSDRSDARDWDAGTSAASAASRALTAVLAYDYRHLEADRDRAVRFFTPGGRKEYLKNFNLLIKGKDGQVGPAVKTKTVVTANVLQTAVADATKNRARVVVFVNQSAVKGDKGTPAVFQNRVVVTMLHRGDDWLVDRIQTY
ncbi:MAG: DnaJ domain-containing protein [Nocardioidaceae bacterium]|nr:DnaJ domain-containing protein [Nocardioidaceae bacterium]